MSRKLILLMMMCLAMIAASLVARAQDLLTQTDNTAMIEISKEAERTLQMIVSTDLTNAQRKKILEAAAYKLGSQMDKLQRSGKADPNDLNVPQRNYSIALNALERISVLSDMTPNQQDLFSYLQCSQTRGVLKFGKEMKSTFDDLTEKVLTLMCSKK